MIKLYVLILASLQIALAAAADQVYAFSIYASGDNAGKCRAAGKRLGKELQDKFDEIVPGSTPYDPSGSVRFLREDTRDLQQAASLSLLVDAGSLDAMATTSGVNLCDPRYCSKPANFQACIWSGCNCTCGRGRQLRALSSDDKVKVENAKKEINTLLETRAAQLGCTLGFSITPITP